MVAACAEEHFRGTKGKMDCQFVEYQSGIPDKMESGQSWLCGAERSRVGRRGREPFLVTVMFACARRDVD